MTRPMPPSPLTPPVQALEELFAARARRMPEDGLTVTAVHRTAAAPDFSAPPECRASLRGAPQPTPSTRLRRLSMRTRRPANAGVRPGPIG